MVTGNVPGIRCPMWAPYNDGLRNGKVLPGEQGQNATNCEVYKSPRKGKSAGIRTMLGSKVSGQQVKAGKPSYNPRASQNGRKGL